jgi:hypothetical protein
LTNSYGEGKLCSKKSSACIFHATTCSTPLYRKRPKAESLAVNFPSPKSEKKRSIAMKTSISTALAAFVVVLSVTTSFAQSPQFAEYTAKFVCGTPTTTQVATGVIEPGTYATSINIHNPNDTIFNNGVSGVTFLKKAVLSLQEGVPLVPPSPLVQDNLPNDFAEEVDCQVIHKLLGTAVPPAPAFIEGYVVILVPPTNFTNKLDVVGVYTNLKGAEVIRPANEHLITPGGVPVANLELPKK